MADKVLPGPVEDTACIREAVCIHTKKIFDSCRDKDCIEDLRVYPTLGSQAYIDSAFSIRPRCAELLHVDVHVDEITFNRGHYTVDVKYFYKITGTVFPGCQEICGLAVFDKRVILFGSEGSAKIFTSAGHCACTKTGGCGSGQNMPIATVEAVDPIALSMKLVDPDCGCIPDCDLREIPGEISSSFGEELCLGPVSRKVYVTLGQFSIIRLERDVQLLIPSYDYCIPEKECLGGGDEDPCTLFSRIHFPIEEFFPPDSCSCPEDYKNTRKSLS